MKIEKYKKRRKKYMESEIETERERKASIKDCKLHTNRNRVCVPVPN